ncbi:MAG: hypothetical protein AAGG59_04545 [Bacteroidota bacterium]
MRSVLAIFCNLLFCCALAQPEQPARFELEKENTDDYFTVLPAGQDGVMIVRDTEKYEKGEGDVWKIVSLNAELEKRWEKELAINEKYIIRGYDLIDGHLYLLFREGEYSKSDYHLIRMGVLDGAVERYDIENEVELELSHLSVMGDKVVLGGYVRFSPTLLAYTLGDDHWVVVPGFFKDKSDIVDLRSNENGTFNAVTLEKDYTGYFLRLRTYSNVLDILFEREIRFKEDYRVLSAKSTGFVDGNIAISGSYGSPNSTYARGIYFVVVKPPGQKNLFSYHSFAELSHFFDYMNPSRARRLKEKVKKKERGGKSYKHTTRLRLNEVQWDGTGYLITAEVYHPKFDYGARQGTWYNYGSPYYGVDGFTNRANSRYVKQSSRLSGVDDANSFEYYESIVLHLDRKGRLIWDNSIPIDNTETLSLEQVVDVTADNGKHHMAYLAEDKVCYQTILRDSVLSKGEIDIKLLHDSDEIRHTYVGMGRVMNWFDDVFLFWGYHRVHNKDVPDLDPRRSVLFINKLTFE